MMQLVNAFGSGRRVTKSWHIIVAAIGVAAVAGAQANPVQQKAPMYTPPPSPSQPASQDPARPKLSDELPQQSRPIEFESAGLRFQTLTRNGVTIMFAALPGQIRNYSVLQVTVTNGSPIAWTLKPEDFRFERAQGDVIAALPARQVVTTMLEHGGRNDVIQLVRNYELTLYGLSRFKSTNGYEQRRQAAFAEVSSTKLKAAATASAIAFTQVKLASGQSTDGALFYQTQGRPLGAGRLTVRAAGEMFVFDPIEALR